MKCKFVKISLRKAFELSAIYLNCEKTFLFQYIQDIHTHSTSNLLNKYLFKTLQHSREKRWDKSCISLSMFWFFSVHSPRFTISNAHTVTHYTRQYTIPLTIAERSKIKLSLIDCIDGSVSMWALMHNCSL